MKNDLKQSVWTGLKAGSASLILSLLLFVPVAWMMARGTMEMVGEKYITAAIVLLSSALAAMTIKNKRGGNRLVTAASATASVLLLIALMIPCMNDARFRMGEIAPVLTSTMAGMLLGSMSKINKKYRQKKKKRA